MNAMSRTAGPWPGATADPTEASRGRAVCRPAGVVEWAGYRYVLGTRLHGGAGLSQRGAVVCRFVCDRRSVPIVAVALVIAGLVVAPSVSSASADPASGLVLTDTAATDNASAAAAVADLYDHRVEVTSEQTEDSST